MEGNAKMKKFLYPVFFDATHSIQLPGGCQKNLYLIVKQFMI